VLAEDAFVLGRAGPFTEPGRRSRRLVCGYEMLGEAATAAWETSIKARTARPASGCLEKLLKPEMLSDQAMMIVSKMNTLRAKK